MNAHQKIAKQRFSLWEVAEGQGNVSADCSIMDKYGITTMIRLRSWRKACLKANAMEENVLPPPVGAVSENRPEGFSRALRQSGRYSSTVEALDRISSYSFAQPMV
jgi:hypothetical protein